MIQLVIWIITIDVMLSSHAPNIKYHTYETLVKCIGCIHDLGTQSWGIWRHFMRIHPDINTLW